MNPIELLQKYYPPQEKAYGIVYKHSRLVANKCLSIAKNKPLLSIDLNFVEEAALLHDIGVYLTNAPSIGCYGNFPYICHGYLGAQLLIDEDLPKHALVAERHTGTGISKDEIVFKNLPIPHRDMLPITLEEQLICFCDKFFSKTNPEKEKSLEEVRASLLKIQVQSLKTFNDWCEFFL